MGRFLGGRVFRPIPNFMSIGIGLRHSSSSFTFAAFLPAPAPTLHVSHGFRASIVRSCDLCLVLAQHPSSTSLDAFMMIGKLLECRVSLKPKACLRSLQW